MRRDGLSGTSFQPGACTRSTKGELFFGTENGLITFFPDQIRPNPHIPPVALTEFYVYGDPAPLDSALTAIQEIELPYNQNFVAFEFAGLDFADPEKNQYQYRMDGVDPDWVRAGTRRFVNYPNLEPRTYHFQVRASNDDGLWNMTGTSVRLIITPPYWETFWFRTLMGFLILIIALSAYQYRRYYQLQAQQIQQRISRDLHDDISTKVSVLALDLDELADTDERPDADRDRLQTLAQTVRSLTQDLRNMVWLVGIDPVPLNKFVDRLEQQAHALLRRHQIHFQPPDPIPDLILKDTVQRNCFLLYKEALQNILSHAQASQVWIEVRIEAPYLTLQMMDDGTGFDPDAEYEGNGLHNMRTRAARLHGRCNWTTRPGGGTCMACRLKIA
jgi:signal transduction histidine kinase